MQRLTSKTLLLLSVFALAITSCKQDGPTPDPEANKNSAVDNQIADNASADIIDQFNSVSLQMSVSSASDKSVESTSTESITNKGGTLTISPLDFNTFPKTITVDFGTGIEKDGVTRKGKIVGTLTDHWWKAGAELTIVPDNYYVNDVKVTGNTVLKSSGFNLTTNSYSFTAKVNKSRITDDGKTITWSAERTVSYYTNGTSNIWSDDYITVTGSTWGTNKRGNSFTTTITTELKKPVNSRWFVSGVIEHQVESRPKAILDYGDGTIDNKATLKVGDISTEITLHR